MKFNYKNSIKNIGLLTVAVLSSLSCERDISDDAVLAEFPSTADIFTDNPVNMGSDFYFPYADAFPEAWSVDEEESYQGSASMRIDVPNADNPVSGYAGGILRIDGAGRNLTDYDALTFWAKASEGVKIDELGFGEDFDQNKFVASITNVSLTTAWKKFIIPIPNASVLKQERGMLRFVATPKQIVDNPDGILNGYGYAFWIDELRFEKLGTLAQPRPKIQNGEDAVAQTFIGGNLTVNGLTQTLNSPSGDITVTAAPAYFEFESSNTNVATVNENGEVNIVGSGTAVITASLNGIDAEGSLTVESLGSYTPAPIPTRDPESVISIFSEAYENRPVDFYNGFYQPFQTTTSSDFIVNGDRVLYYLNFNFVGIEFNQNVPTINGKLATDLHFDIFIPNEPPSNTALRIDLVDFGADASFAGGDDTTISQGFTQGLVAGEWISIDMDITGLNPKTNLGQIILADFNGITPPEEFYVDNIYFYREDGENITPETVALPLDFELSNPANYSFTGFEGAVTSIEDNPFTNGINTSPTVMQSVKTNGAQFFAGTSIDLDQAIDFTSIQTLKMKVYSPKANIPVRLALETAGGGNQVFVDVNTTTSNEWEELEFDFSNVLNTSLDYQRIVAFFEFIEGTSGDGSTYYLDDIQLTN
ncbi:glycosyl hydrolase family 16 [Psychroflexus sp. ALD_RP9]|uniref:glycosyl hydrolase family 16 n=1 Tax=Psychroflexus sp. ALD_RP9 TaxID=2777186 RepID=UPI001A8BF77D|nr:glycosyl hydrolase family 16 [Psychroflexus sp. ALD_RP9]QSS98247.1 glycosyl hydrolase family 16 [Psychroflexus sp. ALD_RP9]